MNSSTSTGKTWLKKGKGKREREKMKKRPRVIWRDTPEHVAPPFASCPRGALCESLCALFELSQPLCFPTVTRGLDSCALTLVASTCLSCVFGLFFLLFCRLLVLRFSFFFSAFLFASSPCYILATSRHRLASPGHVNRFFPPSFSPFSFLDVSSLNFYVHVHASQIYKLTIIIIHSGLRPKVAKGIPREIVILQHQDVGIKK